MSQITFNAWHYSDSELWANLAKHIFDHLAGDDPDQTADALIDRARTDTIADRSRLFDELAAVQVLQSQLDADRREFEQLTERDQGVTDLFRRGKLTTAIARSGVSTADAGLPDLRQTLDRLGLDEPTVDQLRSLSDDLSKTGGSVIAARKTLRRQGRLAPLTVATVAVLLLVAGGIALVLRGYDWEPILTFGASIVTAVVGYARYLKEPLRLVREASDGVTKLAERLETAEVEARTGLAERQTELEQRTRDIAARLQQFERGQQLQAFIAERRAAAHYDAHLGVISHVRRDFEDLVTELQRQPAAEHPYRVILYIDDLDRCEAQHVVKVLQAIHLLLAFPLFVVVVGVDPRWLLGALEEHYSMQLRSGEDADVDLGPTTALHYLEKIFQIPFSVPPMAPDGYARLVEAMLGSASPQGAAPEPGGREPGSVQPAAAATTSPTPAPVADEPEPVRTARAELERCRAAAASFDDAALSIAALFPDGGAPPLPPGVATLDDLERVRDRLDGRRTGRLAILDTIRRSILPGYRRLVRTTGEASMVVARPARRLAPGGAPDGHGRAAVAQRSRRGGEGRSRPPREASVPPDRRVDLQPASLELDPAEVRFATQLSALISTPRATKRLANVYRILRAHSMPATCRRSWHRVTDRRCCCSAC